MSRNARRPVIRHRRKGGRLNFFPALGRKVWPGIFLLLSLFPGWGAAAPEPNRVANESVYQRAETRALVSRVERAAAAMENRGTAMFDLFGETGSRWYPDEQKYLFVYDAEGVCVFHPISPELVGKNMIDFRDFNGKPVIRHMTEVGKSGPGKSGWIFYFWEDGPGLLPEWKASYVRRVGDLPGVVLNQVFRERKSGSA